MKGRRVVITGLGMLTPLGLDAKATWLGILNAQSGIREITEFDTTDFAVKFAGTLEGFEGEKYIPKKDLKKMDTFLQYAIAAADEAIADSNLEVTEENATRIGVSVGSGIGGLNTLEQGFHCLEHKGPKRVSPFVIPSAIINMASGHISIRHGMKGPNMAIVTACTTGTHNIGNAARQIAYGEADVMVAGGAEKSSNPISLAGFASARALSSRNDAPEEASRPWDKDRDGFVLGDGAGVLVLEEYEHAKARGAKIYAELIGYGVSGDAYHMTAPDPFGSYRSMKNAVDDAEIDASSVQYLNAHATSTHVGDPLESQSAEKLWGSSASQLAVSSTKSMVGHLLGAAGAVEAIFTILAIRDQVAPPTINLHNVDEGCNLNYVPNQAQEMKIDVAMSNSFGFGGTNGSLLFKKC